MHKLANIVDENHFYETVISFSSISFNCFKLLYRFHLDQPFIIEIVESSIEFHRLWFFRFGYDNHLCGSFSIRPFDFNVSNVFHFQITGAITSYLIILIQFNVAAQRSKKLFLSGGNSANRTG